MQVRALRDHDDSGMAPKQIFPNVYEHSLGMVNVWFIVDPDGITLIDTGYARNESKIEAGLVAIDKTWADVKRILVTHCHPDHAGSLAAIQQRTRAATYMHPLDAAVVRGQAPMRKGAPAPGFINQLLYRMLIKNAAPQVPAAKVDQEVQAGEVLPISGGLRVVHTPGHSAGHLAFLLERDGGLLFAADACSNMGGLNYSVVYDDLDEGRRSLRNLAQMRFKAMSFGHGGAIMTDASETFASKWG